MRERLAVYHACCLLSMLWLSLGVSRLVSNLKSALSDSWAVGEGGSVVFLEEDHIDLGIAGGIIHVVTSKVTLCNASFVRLVGMTWKQNL